MAGSGSISNKNVFAALDSLKKKKGSSKSSSSIKEAEAAPVVWPVASTLEGKSWADIDDDDDYYAAAPPPVWGSSEMNEKDEEIAAIIEEESESDDDLIEGEEDYDEDVDDEPEGAPIQTEPVVKKAFPAPVAPKDTERQLSKKELKKKELAERDAVLAELGISSKDSRSRQIKENEGLLVGNNDSAPKPQKKKTLSCGNEKGGVLTAESPKSQEGLLVGNNDTASKPQKKKTLSSGNEKGGVLTTEVPKSQVLGKIKDFLGVMAKANEKLQSDAQGTSRSEFDIEVLDGNEQEYIEMDLLLGVADLHTPEAVTAAEATIDGFHPSAASPSSSSSSDSEDDSDEDDDSDNDDITTKCQENPDSENSRLHDNKPDNKPNKRPKIVVLN